ncbi:MAG: hypothetical protein ACLFTK_04100 [Anaerolineales bacterium]
MMRWLGVIAALSLAWLATTAQAQDAPSGDCSGFVSRLAVNDIASVTPGPENQARQEPSIDAPWVQALPAGTRLQINAGPVCAQGITWWQVIVNGRVIGWTGEGISPHDYWLAPVDAATQPAAPGPLQLPEGLLGSVDTWAESTFTEGLEGWSGRPDIQHDPGGAQACVLLQGHGNRWQFTAGDGWAGDWSAVPGAGAIVADMRIRARVSIDDELSLPVTVSVENAVGQTLRMTRMTQIQRAEDDLWRLVIPISAVQDRWQLAGALADSRLSEIALAAALREVTRVQLSGSLPGVVLRLCAQRVALVRDATAQD